MLRRGPLWHVLLLPLLLAGCYEMHAAGRTDAALTLDAAVRVDAGAPVTDDACADAIARLRAGEAPESIRCDARTFPEGCQERVGACCTLFVGCAPAPGDGGHVVTELPCTDLCIHSCDAQSLDDCALFSYCERFEPDACGPAPDGIIDGPACISRRENRCESDADCDEGRTCRSYWVHPCPGGRCAACGREERSCAL